MLYADNEKEKDDWIGAVGKSIVRSSKTYLNDDNGHNQHGNGGVSGRKKNKEKRKMTQDDYGYGYDDDYESDDDYDSDYGGDGGGFENQNNHPYFND